jgi:A/G-specific adenine glycosylase
MPSSFTSKLLHWDTVENKRLMPWKGEKDPYRIWLSEVILQQTRVEQGWNYYTAFIEAFPTISALANAEDHRVFKLWEGLGYYSRCRNLLATARLIVNEYSGVFPSTYKELITLKGIGPYTAAAIASFAFGENKAVVDGNVQRVLARYFGVSVSAGSAAGKKFYQHLAQSLILHGFAAKYNQAIMDFGAIICKPKQPACNQCIQNTECEAFLHNKVNELPFKEPKLQKKHRWFNYFLVESEQHIYLRERTQKDIWQHLYEFLLIETDSEAATPRHLLNGHISLPFQFIGGNNNYKQVLSHQVIHAKFSRVFLQQDIEIQGMIRMKKSEFKRFPFPRLISSYIDAELRLHTDL